MKIFAGLVAVVSGIVGLVLVFSAVNGYVLQVLWGWYVTPMFDLPELSLPVAMGISMMVSLLTHQNMPSDKEETGRLAKFLGTLAGPLVVLFFGWVVHLFV